MWLVLFAAVIVGVSLWYNSMIASRIANNEKNQVQIWAQAVRERAKLLERQSELFARLAEEERRKVGLFAMALQRAIRAELEVSVDPIITEIISSNKTIPVIMVNDDNKIIGQVNTSDEDFREGDILTDSTIVEFTDYEPILIPKRDGLDYIYYQDSRLFKEIKTTIETYVNSFISEVVLNSASVPVIYTNDTGRVLDYGNLDTSKVKQEGYLQQRMDGMVAENDPIVLELQDGRKHFIYYSGSELLAQIQIYPYVQFGIIALFLLIAYYAFSTARKAEQNQVWVGMSKETAHQLGTPISSLVGWVEYLKSSGAEERIIKELEKDVNRLELITERFSKIGSSPELVKTNLDEHLRGSFNYLKSRTSKQVKFQFNNNSGGTLYAMINAPLFDWVVENLVKNALDAMEGLGEIEMTIDKVNGQVSIDVSDTGKGISKSKFKQVFEPGFSTKKRGWGLGLSLTKRIVENYHDGKIFVKHSVVDQGTTFRIVLPAV